MLLTEEQARKKWCPEARTAWAMSPSDDHASICTANRGHTDDNCLCIASDCMMWRWSDEPQQVLARDDKHRRGYCGLAGKLE